MIGGDPNYQPEQERGPLDLKEGQIVKYPSTEQIGYYSLSFDPDDGSPVISPYRGVRLNETGRVQVLAPLKVERDTLEVYNKAVETSDISKASSIGELLHIVSAIGILEGSKVDYSSADLVKLLDNFFQDEVSAEYITRTAGLRDKAIELKELRKQEKETD